MCTNQSNLHVESVQKSINTDTFYLPRVCTNHGVPEFSGVVVVVPRGVVVEGDEGGVLVTLACVCVRV